MTGENHARAFELAEEASEAEVVAQLISNDRDIVNFESWALRCRFEPEDDTLAARKAMYDGDKAYLAAQLPPAGEFYVDGIKNWRKVLDKYPELLKDSIITDDLMSSINRYRNLLHQLAEEFPDPFILQDVIDADAATRAPGLPATSSEQEGESAAEGQSKASSEGAADQPAGANQPAETPSKSKSDDSAPAAEPTEAPPDEKAADEKPPQNGKENGKEK